MRQAESQRKIPAEIGRVDIRMDGVHFFRSCVRPAFVKTLDPGNFSYCVMIRAGRMKLETDFPERAEIELRSGDAVAVSGLAPHTFSSIGAGKDAPDRFLRHAMGRDKAKSEVEVIVGVAPSESLALGSLMVGPIVVRAAQMPDLSRRLWRAVEMLEDEYSDDTQIDRNLVIRRLAEIMLINMSRALLAHRQSVPESAGPGEAVLTGRVMKAITAFFAAPEKPWTLPDLARAAGMSRTRFAQSFKLVTGQTPKRIISRMRLTAIARRLANDPLSVELAAEEAGYGSSAAFVRAFQREFGETPARWRRGRLERAAVTPAHKENARTRRRAHR